ncbi:MAG: hypothetical protein A2487_04865 [Candidatus Raymondbacteria bacterium RifOxyC12_full_50_8]|uniref:Uncharacterized protein n=1 Tax=Candidatus Raymondbacteria bacterium RIFOXYD12_FULL_49_13 TaxID=1817890 RepID=A0A1F7FAH6_UNCRA|nr:MAG: hypothetical protein A2350_20300 [Candidatus Raymondbacteria bacterium RifOxyB12_full_50_8]OGJ92349.1 MAG: hypothetical protein A2248_10365 [Candidatus Raymondbacteria bacterium RIFOXYA2_FULL_49_16]OGJ99330.1 MAG: hypothetical protein A2453_13425 [Candidatus Raymondbacteria bacterium RIFOXYC2_FULL_50_21]OGK00418.1 MAG: hypothetical protein A2487_04865 [Candidatus Raymondbacteria bacterium RifOxyC12_full_50_8]OGK03655.1 MAG: hypothetical protein A2519_02700 [Candidatus Raymondbacteria ba
MPDTGVIISRILFLHDYYSYLRWNTVVGAEDTVYHLGDFTKGGNRSQLRQAKVGQGPQGVK